MSDATPAKFDYRKLMLPAVLALIGSMTSYFKSRAEATDQAKASYEALSSAVLQLQAESKLNAEKVLICTTETTLLKELFENTNQRVAVRGVRPPRSGEGIGMGSLGTLGHGAGPSAPKPPPPMRDGGTAAPAVAIAEADAGVMKEPSQAQQMPLPANLDDAVQRYKSKK